MISNDIPLNYKFLPALLIDHDLLKKKKTSVTNVLSVFILILTETHPL